MFLGLKVALPRVLLHKMGLRRRLHGSLMLKLCCAAQDRAIQHVQRKSTTFHRYAEQVALVLNLAFICVTPKKECEVLSLTNHTQTTTTTGTRGSGSPFRPPPEAEIRSRNLKLKFGARLLRSKIG